MHLLFSCDVEGRLHRERFFCARHSELKFSKLGLTLLLVWESRFVSSDTLITKSVSRSIVCPVSPESSVIVPSAAGAERKAPQKNLIHNVISSFPLVSTTRMRRKENVISAVQ